MPRNNDVADAYLLEEHQSLSSSNYTTVGQDDLRRWNEAVSDNLEGSDSYDWGLHPNHVHSANLRAGNPCFEARSGDNACYLGDTLVGVKIIKNRKNNTIGW